MQNRYAGDIGDYVKLGLLRALSVGRRLGVAWYLHPDEAHNTDGRHIGYLAQPERWRHYDPDLFDALRDVVQAARSVDAIEKAGLLDATFHREPTLVAPGGQHMAHRLTWFERLQTTMQDCDLIFADPDNGLVDNAPERLRDRKHAKQMSLREALTLSAGRISVIYHHNTRFKGGHDREVDHWLAQLGRGAMAIRATAFSCRTFFLVNPDPLTRERAMAFCRNWASAKVRLHG